MKEKIKTICCILLLLVALPYIITMIWQGQGQGQMVALQQGEIPKEEQQLIGIVAHEMPLSYEKEALKAQVILARTNLQLARETGGDEPEGLTAQELENLQREKDSQEQYQKLLAAVAETQGQVMRTDDGNLAAAGFFAVSADVLDLTSPDYLKVIFLEKEEFAGQLGAEVPELAGTDAQAILGALAEAKRDELGYVTEAALGGTVVAGERFRNAWQLNSACFYCKEVEGRIRIVTKGLGHGVGLSQYGANELAKEGKGCQEILQYYFKNIEISD